LRLRRRAKQGEARDDPEEGRCPRSGRPQERDEFARLQLRGQRILLSRRDITDWLSRRNPPGIAESAPKRPKTWLILTPQTRLVGPWSDVAQRPAGIGGGRSQLCSGA